MPLAGHPITVDLSCNARLPIPCSSLNTYSKKGAVPLTADPSKNLTFQCPQCQTRLKAQESYIGKRVA